MATVHNPILPGFHPDPSICRVGECYYVATSTFEWWPGVRLHRSRDLANWELIGGALTRRSQLDMRGNPDSGGVWAPCLTHADGRFWLVYTDAKSLWGPFKDVRNFLVTAERIEGPWSEPIPLNASGFDPSLFHDADGRKWLVCQRWRLSPAIDAFAGITLQEFSVAEQRLVGEPLVIFPGTRLGITEGPHLYRKDGFYWLVTAEGGTGWEHAVTVARSRTLAGPYEVHPANPLLTASGDPAAPLQKAGHASLVETPDGRWFLLHLCSRPVGPQRRCILGRETALQALDWPAGDWPRLASGGNRPFATVELPGVAAAPGYLRGFYDDFAAPVLDPQWNTLREPVDAPWLSLAERPGFLRLRGRYSLQSAFDQSAVGFRLLHHVCAVRTRLEFAPRSFQQQAGLALFYNSANFYYAFVSAGDDGGRALQVLACDNRRFRFVLPRPLPLPATGALEFGARIDGETLQFFLGADAATSDIGPALDATTLSDDHPMEGGVGWAFTGAFAVLCAQDSADSACPADFDFFHYLAPQPNPLSAP
ncbi:MAG TPA: glycoside hydrolase family 43 protein [Opitutaceae bacterium]|nr:glycoside hydrolase family 43 protein [Opitutaceae bacterium]